MSVKIIVDPVNAHIKGLEDLAAIDAISAELSYYIPGHQYNFRFKMGQWDGRERLLTKRLKFPSGLVPRAVKVLEARNIAYEIIEHIEYPDIQAPLLWSGPSLYPYQQQVVERSLNANRGMIKVATGGGKSVMLAKIVAEYNVPTMIYVVSLDLLGQMRETLEDTLGIEVGVIGGGECSVRKITVCSVWTAGLACGEKFKRTDFDEDFTPDKWKPSDLQREQIVQAVHDARLVLLDEAQFAAANSIRMILRHSTNASYKFGLSATPFRENGDDILLEAAFGDQICDISASQLISEGYLVPPKIAFRDIPPYHKKIPKKWGAVKSSYIVHNEVRNDILIKNALTLLEMGRKPLMLFREHKHGEILRDMLPNDVRIRFATGNASYEERNKLRADFQGGQVDLLLCSSIFDQGINLPSISSLLLCGGGKSRGKAMQRIGRAIRTAPGKEDAYIVECFDQAHYVKNHSVIRYNTYKSEPAFIIKTGSQMSQHLGR